MRIKVAIVDDDGGIRAGLATLINRAPDMKLTGDYADAERALAAIPRDPPVTSAVLPVSSNIGAVEQRFRAVN